MRTIVIGVEGVEPDLLLNDSRLVHVQALVNEGIVGRLTVSTDEDVAAQWTAIIGVDAFQCPGHGDGTAPSLTLRAAFEEFRDRLARHAQSDAAIVVRRQVQTGSSAEDSSVASWLTTIDDELRQTLEHLLNRGDEVAILLVVLNTRSDAQNLVADSPRPSGAFVITSSRELPAGEIEGARLIDLAPTLLKLAGKPIPEDLKGSPLELDQLVSRDEADEHAVLERLRGLGYLS